MTDEMNEKRNKGEGRVFILHGPRHSGKSSALAAWCSEEKARQGGHTKVCGFLSTLSPEGLKTIQNIDTHETFPLESKEPGEDTMEIGVKPYYLNKQAFPFAESILALALENRHSVKGAFFVLDEVGPLEVNKELGHHNLLTKLLGPQWRGEGGHVVLVVRDELLDEVCSKYALVAPSIFDVESWKQEGGISSP
jgi:hypothetical protein